MRVRVCRDVKQSPDEAERFLFALSLCASGGYAPMGGRYAEMAPVVPLEAGTSSKKKPPSLIRSKRKRSRHSQAHRRCDNGAPCAPRQVGKSRRRNEQEESVPLHVPRKECEKITRLYGVCFLT
jgi:hypothetical protein